MRRRSTMINQNPALQRTSAMPIQQMSTIDDGYDTETMAKIEANTTKAVEQVKKQCFNQIETRLKEAGAEMNSRIHNIEAGYKSQITETQAAISAIQLDQDQMLEKVRTSQSEILMINKNLAASLKRQRGEIAELQNRGALSSTIIESLLVQAIALEQAMQIHLDHC